MYHRPPGPPNHDPIMIDDDESDEGSVDFPGRQNRPHGMGLRYDTDINRIRGSLSNYHTSIEQEKKVRSRLREERHAALCVLMDRELLTVQALAAQETLPQARRRFLTKLVAPEDHVVANSIRSDVFIVQHLSSSPSSNAASNTTPLTVHRSVVDVHETDDAGWRRPAEAGSSTPAVSSPASSAKNKGRLSTPDRTKAKGRVSTTSASGSAGRGKQFREWERRRRWSGAEREEYGTASP